MRPQTDFKTFFFPNSRLDFYSDEGGRRNSVTMGLAPVGGVCLPAHACVVSEFGVTDLLGRPFPSAGFTSVYILAHEIGHKSVTVTFLYHYFLS